MIDSNRIIDSARIRAACRRGREREGEEGGGGGGQEWAAKESRVYPRICIDAEGYGTLFDRRGGMSARALLRVRTLRSNLRARTVAHVINARTRARARACDSSLDLGTDRRSRFRDRGSAVSVRIFYFRAPFGRTCRAISAYQFNRTPLARGDAPRRARRHSIFRITHVAVDATIRRRVGTTRSRSEIHQP